MKIWRRALALLIALAMAAGLCLAEEAVIEESATPEVVEAMEDDLEPSPDETAEGPVDEVVEEPIDEAMNEPVVESKEEPTGEPAEEPVVESSDDPVIESMGESTDEPMEVPGAESMMAFGAEATDVQWFPGVEVDGFSISPDGELQKYYGDWADVRVPEGVTQIGDSAFAYKENVHSVYLPESMVSIGIGAFRDCVNLERVNFPPNLKSIGADAFLNCTKLESLDFPDGLERIDGAAFWRCSSIRGEIRIPGSVTHIGWYDSAPVFGDSKHVDSFVIESGSTPLNIGYELFFGASIRSITIERDCVNQYRENFGYEPLDSGGIFYRLSGETNVKFADGVTMIPDVCFRECDGLLRAEIPDSVVSIGEGAFYGCSKLNYAPLPKSLESMGTGAFFKCESLRRAEIPEGMTSVPESAFQGCKSLTRVEIPQSVTEIGNSAFSGCEEAQILRLPDGLVRVGDAAFSGCLMSAEFTLPASLRYVGDRAFSGGEFEHLTIPGSIEHLGEYAFYECNRLESVTFEEGLTSIPPYLFQGSGIREIALPESLTSIGESAFYDCRSLRSVRIPKGIRELAPSLFKVCEQLERVELPEGLTEIGASAFESCYALTSISFPDGMTGIGANAFAGCGLSSITIPDSVTVIGEAAFKACSNLKSVKLSKGLTRIENETFYYVPLSGVLEIPEGIVSIGERAFRGCKARRLLLPKSLIRIESEAFSGWDSDSPLTLTIPGNVEWIGDRAFSGSNVLQVIAEPGVKELGNGVFQGCGSLSIAKFSEGLTRIGDEVFLSAMLAVKLILPASLTSIGKDLFSDHYYYKHYSESNVIAPRGSYVQSYCEQNGINWCEQDEIGTISTNLKDGDAIKIDGKEHKLTWDAVPGATRYYASVEGNGASCSYFTEKPKRTLEADLFHEEQDIPIIIHAYDESGKLLAETEFTIHVVSNGQTLKVEEEISIGWGESYKLKPVSSIKKDSFSYKADTFGDFAIVSISKDGKLTGKMVTSTNVYVTSKKGGHRTTLRVNVLDAPSGVELNAEKLALLKGAKFQLNGRIVSGYSNAPLKYKSSKPKIAKVDANGLVTALKPGTAKITCSAYNGEKAVSTVVVSKSPKSIRFQEKEKKLSVGQVVQLEIEGSCAVNSYRSSDESVAFVDDNGICTARQPGTTTITASTSSGLTDSCTLTVVPAPDEILPIEDIYLGAGETCKISPVALYRGEEIPASFTFNCIYGEDTVSISKDGVAKGLWRGEAHVTAKSQNGLKTRFTIHASFAPSKIVPSTKICKLGQGHSYRLHVRLVDENGDAASSKLKCSSNKKSVATVEEVAGEPGVFNIKAGNKKGSATITITTYNGKKASCKVTVVSPPKKFRLNDAEVTLGVGESAQLTYTMGQKNMFTLADWSSTDKEIATVDTDGCVTAHHIGKATIRGVVAEGMSDECELTVVPAPTELIVPETITLRKGQKYQIVPEINEGSHCSFTFRCFQPEVLTVDPVTGWISVKKKPKSNTAYISVVTHNELCDDIVVNIK